MVSEFIFNKFYLTEDLVNLMCLWFFLILADFISGMLQALINHDFKSSKMREGLINKAKSLLTIIVCMLFDSFGSSFMPMAILPAVLVYMVFMEASSIIENFGLLLPDSITKIFKNGGK